MAGFPNRPDRTAFGPTREDEQPVQNPVRELGAADMNLDFWQVSGMGLTSPRVTIIAEGSNVADPLPTPHAYQGIAWDPLQLLPSINITHAGTGIYQATFQPTYPDQDATVVATSLKGGQCVPQTLLNLNGVIQLPDAQTVDIRIFTADTGALTDADFLLLLW